MEAQQTRDTYTKKANDADEKKKDIQKMTNTPPKGCLTRAGAAWMIQNKN